MKKIITMTAWRRSDYLNQVIRSLENAIGIDDYQVWISIDGGHPREQKKMTDIANKSPIKIKVFSQNKNWGCAKNTWNILKTGFDHTSTDYIIHLEDDIIVSTDFILWMEAGLEKYRNNKKIFTIAASSNNKKVRTDPNDAKRTTAKQFFSCWGWGTWRHIWNEMSNDWFGITWKRNARSLIDKPTGKAFLDIVNKTDKGSWAWPMNMYWRQDRYEVKPLISRIYNIGRERGLFGKTSIWDKKHKNKQWMGNLNLPIPNNYDFPEM